VISKPLMELKCRPKFEPRVLDVIFVDIFIVVIFSVDNQLRYAQAQLDKLKKTNVFNATFHIW
jgi:hypothetical protein